MALPSLFDIPLWVETDAALALPGVCDLLSGDTPSAEDGTEGLPFLLDADIRWTLSSLRASSPGASGSGQTDVDDALAAGYSGEALLEQAGGGREKMHTHPPAHAAATRVLSPATCGTGCTQCVPRPSLAAPRPVEARFHSGSP